VISSSGPWIWRRGCCREILYRRRVITPLCSAARASARSSAFATPPDVPTAEARCEQDGEDGQFGRADTAHLGYVGHPYSHAGGTHGAEQGPYAVAEQDQQDSDQHSD
jgi:hypothetical protein